MIRTSVRVLRIYSTFDLKYFLNITGANERSENTQSIKIDPHENAIVELVILYSVFPAWMASRLGGATLKFAKFIISIIFV